MSKTNRGGALAFLGICLLLSPQGNAQNAVAPVLAEGVARLSQVPVQEKVYLHTDRAAYLAGETLWFKAYKVDATHHQPVDLSKVLYVEVLNAEQVPVLQAKVALEKGAASGYLELPTTLVSGNYVLRAYTSWMKNAGPAFFFEKPLTLINTFSKLNAAQVEPAIDFDVQFFPEGGQLVSGLESKVAFRAVDKNGKGGSFVGAVLNERNDTVARFYTHKFGIGRFLFRPTAGSTYRALLKGPNGLLLTRPLPAAAPTGTVLQLSESTPGHITVKVQVRPAGAAGNAHVLVHTRQNVQLAQTIALDAQGTGSLAFPTGTLNEGISHITIFNDQRQPVSERLYFKKPQQQVMQVKATLPRLEFAPRAEVTVDLEALAATGQPVPADLSMAVYRLDSLQGPEPADITSYFWLSSDLKGTIESPEYYLTTNGPEADIATDNLMLTHGWRRFTWQEVLQPTARQPVFLPEIGGHLLQAKLTDRQTKQPVHNILTYLSAPSRMVALYGSRSDAAGRVLYDVKNLYGTRDLVLQTNTQRDSTYQFEIADPFSAEPTTLKPAPLQFQPSLLNRLQSNSLHLQVQSYHLPAPQFAVPAIDSAAFYGTPDRRYLLDDFTRFPLVEDVLREYVPAVQVRKRNRKFQFAVVDQFRKEAYREEPLVLLDGVPVFATDSIMTYDPKNIRQLDVVAKKYYLGPLAFQGIVSFSTYTGNLKGFPVDPRALLVEYEGLQLHREFFSPRYNTPEAQASRLPDLRTLLHWAPYISTDAQGKSQVRFYTSDQKGRYQLVLQGITKDGKTGSAVQTFVVR